MTTIQSAGSRVLPPQFLTFCIIFGLLCLGLMPAEILVYAAVGFEQLIPFSYMGECPRSPLPDIVPGPIHHRSRGAMTFNLYIR